MRKLIDFFSSDEDKQKDNSLSDSNSYEYILIQLIDEVVKKRKKVHVRYNLLIEKVWISARTINQKLLLAKYLLGRLLRESDRIFLRAQHLAKKLCPKCNQQKINKIFYDYSGSLH